MQTQPTEVIRAGVPALNEGEYYAGILLGKNGAPDQHVILLPGNAGKVSWKKAQEWAAAAGGELPTRREHSLLFANLGELFERAWYWSGEEYEGNSAYAWSQGFSYGLQGSHHKSAALRAVAVRRLVI